MSRQAAGNTIVFDVGASPAPFSHNLSAGQSDGTGRFLAPSGNLWISGEFEPEANKAYYARFVPEVTFDLTGIGVSITAAGGATDTVALAIYDAEGNVVYDNGGVSQDLTNATNVSNAVSDVTLYGGQPYYATFLWNGGGLAVASIADEVKAAIEAKPEAAALVTVADAGGNDGSGVVTTFGPTNLAGGDVGVSAELTTSLTGANNDIVFTAVATGVGGNDISIQYSLQQGDGDPIEVVVNGSTILVRLEAEAVSNQIKTACATYPHTLTTYAHGTQRGEFLTAALDDALPLSNPSAFAAGDAVKTVPIIYLFEDY